MNQYTAPRDFTFGAPQRRGATTFAAVPNATARVPIVPHGNQEWDPRELSSTSRMA